jgi:hypothetical protein
VNKGIIITPILIIIITGCTILGGITGTVKNLPQVKEFLEQYPNAELRIITWNKEYTELNLESIRNECGDQMQSKDYYHVNVLNNDLSLTI